MKLIELNLKSYKNFKKYFNDIKHLPSEFENSTDLENKIKCNL
jgi:hypothetical protein